MGKLLRYVCLMLLMQCAIGADAPAQQSICSVCHCIAKEAQVVCNNSNLFRLFSNAEWAAINSSDAGAIETVRFENNGIEVVSQFPTLAIRHLSFRHNAIRKIEKAAFRNLTLLETLDLSFNRLTYEELHPTVFEGAYDAATYEPLKNLKVLNLSNNHIHTLDPDIFEHFPNLEELILSYNPFEVIDRNTEVAISSIGRLTTLDMSYMELKTLPDSIFHAPRMLKTLNLSGNLFTKIPDAIQHALNLVKLNLDDNVIEKIGTNETGGSFPLLPKLEYLSFSFMPKLTFIGDAAFSKLVALQHYHGQSNLHLSSIHEHAFSRPGEENKYHAEWPPITSLIMYNNNLSTFPHDLLGRWDEVEEIDLRFNYWQCDCANQWMIETLMPIIKVKSPAMMEDILCREPDEMAGKSFHEIFKNGIQMRCLDYYGRHPERDGPILIGILIGLLIGIPVSMAIILLYKRGCFGIFGYKPHANDYTRAFYKRAGIHENLDI